MDLTPAAELAAFRQRIRDFLTAHLPAGWEGPRGLDPDERAQHDASWRRMLHENGLLAVAWPEEYGGAGLSRAEQFVLTEEFASVGAPLGVPNDLLGIGMLGSTLLAWGTEDQRQRLLPRILSGEDVWCEGFSEPGAGSDLANISCRAVADGGRWVIHGQKVWTSYAHTANHIFLLARTGADVPAHQALTFLLVPMDQPGVVVRRIRNLSGDGEFSEVFFDGATCELDDLVGEVGRGWQVAMTLLAHERGNLVVTNHVQHRAELDRVVALARRRGRNVDPVVRQRLAACHTAVELMRYQALCALSADVQSGPGVEPALVKLCGTEHHHRVTDLALDLLGPAATVVEGPLPASVFGPDPAGGVIESGSWIGARFNALAGTIYAGTSEVQRTIIGERVLGLPKEPRSSD